MQGNGLPCYIKIFSNTIQATRFFRYQVENCSSGRFGDRLEYISSDFHNMQVFTCKYMRKHSLAQIYFKSLPVHQFPIESFAQYLEKRVYQKMGMTASVAQNLYAKLSWA